MYKVGDKVILFKYQTFCFHGIIEYIKGYDTEKRFYVVRTEEGVEDCAEEEIILDD